MMAHLSVRFRTRSPEETRQLGEAIARLCEGGEVFLLDGDLGAGKTCFTQGLARGLDVPGEVTSPTFVLHCQYSGRLELNHIDAYRLEDAPNLGGLGFDELFGDPANVTVIEWPQMISALLPKGCVHVLIRTVTQEAAGAPVGEAAREFLLEATHAPAYALIERLSEQVRLFRN